ncbi:uncharacterized protein BCR38DRAFT_487066 [Pseudomassariella vexata]|uniref:Uncharacterized protein n=1 Tax=Pseudomassariella vexata TaxID=1141098 RepID=A0A1Y2DQ51_9PEZI|nr:uncharacterized protein BCR38DRAFT_487066 [Pseudomassariella vexata]ORY61309.1 hypothetical protein BCR38DRAFT_487066 [Pseudomassariella vexata]
MDGFFSDEALSQDSEALFPGLLLAESQISDLDISSNNIGLEEPPPASPASPKPIRRRTIPRFNPRKRYSEVPLHPSSDQHQSRHQNESWDADAIAIDAAEVPRWPDESQQDLAERINNLRRMIHNNAQFCLEVSGKMITLAKENKHLIATAESTLSAYVLQPCLKLGSSLQTYYPGVNDGLQALREYETNLRRSVVNRAKGQEMARIGMVDKGKMGEVNRLKDRLVEQDALLHDSNSHVQRLIRERELLKKQLAAGLQGLRDGASSVDSGSGNRYSPRYPYSVGLDDDGDEATAGGVSATALADQLRELRVLVDQLTLHEVSSREREDILTEGRPAQNRNDDDENSDDDWTHL